MKSDTDIRIGITLIWALAIMEMIASVRPTLAQTETTDAVLSSTTKAATQLDQPIRVLLEDRLLHRFAWSPDGKIIAAVVSKDRSRDGEVQLLDAESGQLRISLPIRAKSIAFAPDGKTLLTLPTGRRKSGGQEAPWDVILWNAATAEIRRQFEFDEAPVDVEFSPTDGETIAFAIAMHKVPRSDSYGAVVLIDAKTGSQKQRMTHQKPVDKVAFSPDGKQIAAAGIADTVQVWNTATGERLHESKGWRRLAFSPTGKLLATSWMQSPSKTQFFGEVRLHDSTNGNLIRTLSRHDRHADAVILWIDFSRKGNLIATASYDGTVKLWDANSGQLSKTLIVGEKNAQIAVFSSDGKTLATCGASKGIALWDVSSLHR